MPANNCRVLSDELLAQLNDKYSVVYNPDDNTLVVSLKKMRRTTVHNADGWFHINSKVKPKKKIVFSREVIEIFKELQQDAKTKYITIFDAQNAANKLRVMYQKITKQKIIELCMKGFDGIKRI